MQTLIIQATLHGIQESKNYSQIAELWNADESKQ